MTTPERLAYPARIYVSCVIAAGAFAVLHAFLSLIQSPIPWQWSMLAVLTLLSGSFTVKVPGVAASLSVSDTFVFAATVLFGPSAATMIVVLDTLVISFWLGRASAPPSRLPFNIAAPSLSIWAASHLVFFITGIQPVSVHPIPALSIVLPLFGLAAIYFLLNTWLVAFAVALQRHAPVVEIWKHNFLWLALNYFSGASVAALLLPYLLQAHTYNSFLYVTGVLLPVLLIFYWTFKVALARVEDANKHLSELNRLYISTIETLAMAIDAKDQITHGHIRRVQQYAVQLATHMGVKDAALISAIEAASLLHDMGKLAVPEYILNKPGKLTASEFEKMKLHASVGADILSAIEFPYPVVPIVRHHHENWDGSGYPDRLKGTDIPIGARILSVVDCFDALTSDRPYRPRLTDADAIKILRDRRGTMYDPLVVDGFIQVHAAIAPRQEHPAVLGAPGLSAITSSASSPQRRQQALGLEEITASTEETLVLYELSRGLSGSSELTVLGDVLTKQVKRLLPATTLALYVHEVSVDELVAVYVSGENATQLSGLRIARGERITGWVAANGLTILNSDPALDLGDLARTMRPRLLSCLSTPVLVDHHLVGALSLYSSHPDAFNENHRRIIEVIARQLGANITRILNLWGRGVSHDKARSAQDDSSSVQLTSSVASLIVLSIRDSQPTQSRRRDALERALTAMSEATRGCLRGGDLLLRTGRDEVVVLLMDADPLSAATICDRIERTLRDLSTGFDNQGFAIVIGVAASPADGLTIESLAGVARRREHPLTPPPSQSVH